MISDKVSTYYDEDSSDEYYSCAEEGSEDNQTFKAGMPRDEPGQVIWDNEMHDTEQHFITLSLSLVFITTSTWLIKLTL